MSALPDRFWAKVQKTETCWLWTGALNSRGYGCFGVEGKTKLAHRLSYEAEVGPIPEGLTIDHVNARGCTSKRCVRPDHLEPVTIAVNNRRATRLITHCVAGHPLPERRSKRGKRVCRECANAARQRHQGPVPEGVMHGHTSTYNYYRCRCAACKQANSDYNREYRNRRTARAAGYEIAA